MLFKLGHNLNRFICTTLAVFTILGVNPVLHAEVTRPRYAKSWKDRCPIDLDKLVSKLDELQYSDDKEHMFHMLKHLELIYKTYYHIRLNYRKIAQTQEQLDVIDEYESYWQGMKILNGYVPSYDSRVRAVYATDQEIDEYERSGKKENSSHIVWSTTICLIGGAMMGFPPTRKWGFYLLTTGAWDVCTHCMDEWDRANERGHYKNLDRRDRQCFGERKEMESPNLQRRERREYEKFYND